jgi:dolichyl-phosphate beta-glucosyltransferase
MLFDVAPPITLTVVVPMFNEAARIERTVQQLSASKVWRSDVEFLFVDDGSTDATVPTTQAALDAAPGASARIIRAQRNGGKGAAVRLGVLAAKGDVIGFVDADLSLNPNEIERAYDLLLCAQADAVIGERIVVSSRKSRLRRLESLVFRRVVEAIVHTGVADPQCALKLFRKEVAVPVFSCMSTDGFAFDVEVLAMLRRGRLRMRELPVVWEHQPGSRVDPFRDALRMVQQVVQIRRRLAAQAQPSVVAAPEPAILAAGDAAA